MLIAFRWWSDGHLILFDKRRAAAANWRYFGMSKQGFITITDR